MYVAGLQLNAIIELISNEKLAITYMQMRFLQKLKSHIVGLPISANFGGIFFDFYGNLQRKSHL